MRINLAGKLFAVLIVCCGLIGCGRGGSSSTTPIDPQSPPTTLTGNWLLAGTRVPVVYPVVSTSLFVTGASVTGQTAFSAQCMTPSFTSTFGATGFPLTGIIANDGTFQATTGVVGNATSGTFSLVLSGNSPLPATPAVWTGTYTVNFVPGSNNNSCTILQTANFAASPIAPFTGTYVGIPVPGLANAFGSASQVTLQVVQGPPTAQMSGTSPYRIPLSGSITVANSPCALSASTSPAQPGYIGGDHLQMSFIPNSTSGFIDGTLNDATAKGFAGDLTSLAMSNGCTGSLAFYTFTRQ